jgi:hypothetical protein
MSGRDPLRMLYVGVLSTLLLLTGCLGFFGDDVVDSATAEVSEDDFETLQTTVSALDTLITSHTTDLLDLKARVAALEAATGPDMSGYASEASLAAMEAQITQLQSQYDALVQNNNNGGQTTTSANALPILDAWFQIDDEIYHPDDITELSQIYEDAGDGMVSVRMGCDVYHPEGESITKVGIDYNHDGITDIDVQVSYNNVEEYYHCIDGIDDGEGDDNAALLEIPVSEFNILERDDGEYERDQAYITLGIMAEDASGDFNWIVGIDRVEVISYENWMGIDFIVSDAAEQISNQPDDDLIVLEFTPIDSDLSVGVGYCHEGYTDLPEYCIRIDIQEYSEGNYCRVGHYYYDDRCTISNTDGSYFSNGIELFDGDQITIQEDTEWYYQLCNPDYNSGGCELTVYVRIYEFNPNYYEYERVGELEQVYITVY